MKLAWTAPVEFVERSRTKAFLDRHGLEGYPELVERSLAEPEWFWESVVDFLEIPFIEPYRQVLDKRRGKPWATWFVDGKINLADVCVDRFALDAPDRLAVISEREEGGEPERLTMRGLAARVAELAGGLRGLGVEPGDAVAVFLPISAEAVISMLAIARVGAIFIPVFSGFGPEAVATRLNNPKPKVLITADGFLRRGHLVEMKEVADQAMEAAGGVARVVVIPYAGRPDTPMTKKRDVWLPDLKRGPDHLAATGAEDPVLLAYTSGTTGRPKGAVHVHGGFTIKVAQEGAFNFDLRPGDVLSWATDMGWIMGPWMVVAGLANGAAIATYDGAFDYPGPDRLWANVAKVGTTVQGVSPTLIRTLQPYGADLARSHDLGSLRLLGSTGEPWNPDPWWWLFREVGGERLPIINITGGTEIGAVLVGVNPLEGVKPTSLGGPALGVAADVFSVDGLPVRGEVGELVVKEPWPGMTRGFWGEPERYLETYWQRWPEVWVHGDWASIDEEGFWFLHGRSDDTLNIGGKRIGPAELESVVVSHPDIVMAAAIGVPHEIKGEVVEIYAVPRAGVGYSDELREELAGSVANTLGKAFRPAGIHLVPDLPRTRSQKIMRRVVKALRLGQEPGDLSSLENPASLEHLR